MKQDENSSDASIFNAWKVFSKLYNALYCSRNKDPEYENSGNVPKERPTENVDSSDFGAANAGGAEAAEEGEVKTDNRKNEHEKTNVSWFEAIKEQQIDKVKEYIAQGINVNDTDELGWSALHIAAWNDYTDICEQLISSHADVNLPGPGSSSPLSLAAQRGHTTTVKLLLTAQCNVAQTADLGDSLDVTALHLAAQHGHAEVVRLLIDAGALVNATMTVRGINGVTPLHLAVQNEHLDIIDMLIEAGCDVHSSTQPQNVPQEGSTEQTEQNLALEISAATSAEYNKTMESTC